ncbi:efflux RND transporter periplasmic adaptor subunit [Novosphingobium umbonatum]|uniref:Efflux RND transporter periplasmic adaptor subunit n=1 Tax=Novosphingobium umbonatum TaxID=1908524 RepID=A0A3S2Y760_9SPHN|nr:efflux RND transporter periplasmic adaptor subunit [Novosphingobium umbonatum]RVU05052.1 efflux RND transporter periplasmic adaptor subunit [Novosphingobium umbonatum]
MNYDTRLDAQALTKGHDADQALDEAPPFPARKAMLAVGVAVVAVAGIWFVTHRDSASSSAAPVNSAPLVTVAVPGQTQIAGTVNVNGALAAKHDMPIGVVGDGGTVVSVLVNPGDWVRKGQVLAIIDRQVQTQQQANSAANVGVAQADARIAQANLDRGLKLVANGFISNADIDKLTAVRDAANARVKVAQAQLGEVQARLRRLTIVAPADGLLLDRALEPGQVVSPGSGVLFRIAEHGEMEMRARLSETDLQQLKLGQEVKVSPVGSAKQFTGKIWQISPVIDPATRQGVARIALAYSPDIRPGGFASAEIRSGTISAPLLPESALQSDNAGNYVFVINGSNKAERRRVKIALVTEKGVAIASGLNGSEKVVLRAGAFLNEGETVDPRLAAKP